MLLAVVLLVSCAALSLLTTVATASGARGDDAVQPTTSIVTQVHGFGASVLEQLATKEVVRYWTLLSGRRPSLAQYDGAFQPAGGLVGLLGNAHQNDNSTRTAGSSTWPDEAVVLLTVGHPFLAQLQAAHPNLAAAMAHESFSRATDPASGAPPDAFILQHLSNNESANANTPGAAARASAAMTTAATTTATLCLVGATPLATLYAAYELVSRMGAHFSLNGDALPPANADVRLPRFHLNGSGTTGDGDGGVGRTTGAGGRNFGGGGLVAAPLYADRGLQPFHDFPMGPDWWQPEFWKALASQMAKLRFNFWGFHTCVMRAGHVMQAAVSPRTAPRTTTTPTPSPCGHCCVRRV